MFLDLQGTANEMKIYRILIYEGEEEWVKETLKYNKIKGISEFHKGTITSLYIESEKIETLLEWKDSYLEHITRK